MLLTYQVPIAAGYPVN